MTTSDDDLATALVSLVAMEGFRLYGGLAEARAVIDYFTENPHSTLFGLYTIRLRTCPRKCVTEDVGGRRLAETPAWCNSRRLSLIVYSLLGTAR